MTLNGPSWNFPKNDTSFDNLWQIRIPFISSDVNFFQKLHFLFVSETSLFIFTSPRWKNGLLKCVEHHLNNDFDNLKQVYGINRTQFDQVVDYLKKKEQVFSHTKVPRDTPPLNEITFLLCETIPIIDRSLTEVSNLKKTYDKIHILTQMTWKWVPPKKNSST